MWIESVARWLRQRRPAAAPQAASAQLAARAAAEDAVPPSQLYISALLPIGLGFASGS
jgi:hypothetical protein